MSDRPIYDSVQIFEDGSSLGPHRIGLQNPIGTCFFCKKVTRVLERYIPLHGPEAFCFQGRRACAARLDRALVARGHRDEVGTPFHLVSEMNRQSWADARWPTVPTRLPNKARRALRSFALAFERIDSVRDLIGGAWAKPEEETLRDLHEVRNGRVRQVIAVLQRVMGRRGWNTLITAYEMKKRQQRDEPVSGLSYEGIKRSAERR